MAATLFARCPDPPLSHNSPPTVHARTNLTRRPNLEPKYYDTGVSKPPYMNDTAAAEGGDADAEIIEVGSSAAGEPRNLAVLLVAVTAREQRQARVPCATFDACGGAEQWVTPACH